MEVINIPRLKNLPIVGIRDSKVISLSEKLANAYNENCILENFSIEESLGFKFNLINELSNKKSFYDAKEEVLFIEYNQETKFVVPSLFLNNKTYNKYFTEKIDTLNEDLLFESNHIKKGKVIVNDTKNTNFNPEEITNLIEAFDLNDNDLSLLNENKFFQEIGKKIAEFLDGIAPISLRSKSQEGEQPADKVTKKGALDPQMTSSAIVKYVAKASGYSRTSSSNTQIELVQYLAESKAYASIFSALKDENGSLPPSSIAQDIINTCNSYRGNSPDIETVAKGIANTVKKAESKWRGQTKVDDILSRAIEGYQLLTKSSEDLDIKEFLNRDTAISLDTLVPDEDLRNELRKKMSDAITRASSQLQREASLEGQTRLLDKNSTFFDKVKKFLQMTMQAIARQFDWKFVLGQIGLAGSLSYFLKIPIISAMSGVIKTLLFIPLWIGKELVDILVKTVMHREYFEFQIFKLLTFRGEGHASLTKLKYEEIFLKNEKTGEIVFDQNGVVQFIDAKSKLDFQQALTNDAVQSMFSGSSEEMKKLIADLVQSAKQGSVDGQLFQQNFDTAEDIEALENFLSRAGQEVSESITKDNWKEINDIIEQIRSIEFSEHPIIQNASDMRVLEIYVNNAVDSTLDALSAAAKFDNFCDSAFQFIGGTQLLQGIEGAMEYTADLLMNVTFYRDMSNTFLWLVILYVWTKLLWNNMKYTLTEMYTGTNLTIDFINMLREDHVGSVKKTRSFEQILRQVKSLSRGKLDLDYEDVIQKVLTKEMGSGIDTEVQSGKLIASFILSIEKIKGLIEDEKSSQEQGVGPEFARYTDTLEDIKKELVRASQDIGAEVEDKTEQLKSDAIDPVAEISQELAELSDAVSDVSVLMQDFDDDTEVDEEV